MSQRPRISSHCLGSRVLLAIVLALAFVLGACGVATPRATETALPSATAPPPRATDTPAGPTSTPTPDPAVLLRDGGIALIRTAYDKLLDEYIDPLQPQSLLSQAWYGVQQEASAEGLGVPPAPQLSGDRQGDFAAFRDAYVPIAAHAADASKLRFAAIKTMASSLNDCHTFFLIPVASATLNGTRQGVGSVGIGVELAGVPPLVTEVVSGGPAARQGVLVGDRIAAIDGSDATNLGPQGALDLINGVEGTSVGLRLRRSGQTQLVDVSIRRERVVPQNIDSRAIGDTGIGYLRVRNFVDSGIAAPIKDVLRNSS